ncbi:MAG: polyprenyl synthetase family protein [Bifidobacteriaceae bacterium]|jgi:geranylgeranyl diphosphate synthase type I|nr:polyprenyl synthetase family protein [Bifidobacteriaceae bacterium]
MSDPPAPATTPGRADSPPPQPWFDPEDVSRAVAGVARETVDTAVAALSMPPRGPLPIPHLDTAGLDLLTSAFMEAADGGKYLRAHLALTAWGALGGPDCGTDGPASSAHTLAYPHMIHLAAALELFQISALIHDDIVDAADTRRARPSAHKHLEAALGGRVGPGYAERLGRDLAILLGDLALVASERQVHLAIRDTSRATAGAIAGMLDTMREQVMVGQFLDTLAPAMPLGSPQAAIEDAMGVVMAKAAHYSVTCPLLVGALAAGADEAECAALASFGAAIGLAFQLRDDILGVFAAQHDTGKPADGDLKDGKRTVLVALARRNLAPGPRDRLAAILAGGADSVDLDEARRLIRDSGAVDDIERAIARYHEAGLDALSALPGVSREPLRALAWRLVYRTA